MAGSVLCDMFVGCVPITLTSVSANNAAKQFHPEPGKASIYVNRGGGIGTIQRVQILLDGQFVGVLTPYTFLLLSVTPEEHAVSTGAGMENVEAQKVDAEAGDNYFFSINLAPGWLKPRVHLKPMGEQDGIKAVMGSDCAGIAN